jgi:hypothetical protein
MKKPNFGLLSKKLFFMKKISTLLSAIILIVLFSNDSPAQTQVGKYVFNNTVNAIVTEAYGSTFLIVESLAESAFADRNSAYFIYLYCTPMGTLSGDSEGKMSKICIYNFFF